MLDDFASLDEAHRGVEPAVIRRRAGSKVNEDRVGISMDHLNRDTAPGMHPGAPRQRPMIAAFEHRARRQMREIRRVAALRELLEIVECDPGDHIRRWSGIRFEQGIEVRRGETDAVMDLGWAQVTEAGAVLCASLGEALGEDFALALSSQKTHFHCKSPFKACYDVLCGRQRAVTEGTGSGAGRGSRQAKALKFGGSRQPEQKAVARSFG